MQFWTPDDLDPSLNDMERQMYTLLQNLSDAMAWHRYADPASPRISDFMKRRTDSRAAMKERRAASREHRKSRGPLEPNPYISLEKLWPMIDPPSSLAITRAAGDDLEFDGFTLCQRYVDEIRSPDGSWARWYIVAIPTGTQSFRCIAIETSCRVSCTTKSKLRCRPPASDDFAVVRVSGLGVNFETGQCHPTVMRLYLPGCYSEWSILKAQLSAEEVLGAGDG